MLFGTSNMLRNGDVATRPRLKRMLMQAIVSLVILAASFFVICMHGFDPGSKRWCYVSVGMVVGYWLKVK